MHFITFLKTKPGFTKDELTARRIEYVYPENLKVVAEYWLPTDDPKVIVVLETESVEEIFEALRPWDQYFEATVIPAMTAERGLRLAHERMAVTVA